MVSEPEGEASNLDASLTVRVYVCIYLYIYIYIYIRSIYITTPQLCNVYIYIYISIAFTSRHLSCARGTRTRNNFVRFVHTRDRSNLASHLRIRRLARRISEGMCKKFTRDCHERIRSLLPAVAAHRLRSLRYRFTLGMLPRWTCVCVFPATSWRKGCDSHFLPTSGTKNPSLHGHKKASSCTRGRICSHLALCA